MPPFTYTISQRKNGPNYHFHLGLISADELPATYNEKPPQVFQSSRQTLTMEGHYTSHDIFYQTLSRRLWKNMNKEVHLRHLPHCLSNYFGLYLPYITREYY